MVGESTHRSGTTLDLALTNIKEASAWVAGEECMISDHLPIWGFAPNLQHVREKPPPSDETLRVP